MRDFAKLLEKLGKVPEERPEYVTDPYDYRDMNEDIASYSKQLSPEDLEKIHYVESSGGKNLQNPVSSASGHYQLVNSTRKLAEDLAKQQGFDVNEPNPLRKEAILMKALVKKSENVLENAKKGPFEPNVENIYLMHKNGIQGGLDALNDPKNPKSRAKFEEIKKLFKRNQQNPLVKRDPSSIDTKQDVLLSDLLEK